MTITKATMNPFYRDMSETTSGNFWAGIDPGTGVLDFVETFDAPSDYTAPGGTDSGYDNAAFESGTVDPNYTTHKYGRYSLRTVDEFATFSTSTFDGCFVSIWIKALADFAGTNPDIAWVKNSNNDAIVNFKGAAGSKDVKVRFYDDSDNWTSGAEYKCDCTDWCLIQLYLPNTDSGSAYMQCDDAPSGGSPDFSQATGDEAPGEAVTVKVYEPGD